MVTLNLRTEKKKEKSMYLATVTHTFQANPKDSVTLFHLKTAATPATSSSSLPSSPHGGDVSYPWYKDITYYSMSDPFSWLHSTATVSSSNSEVLIKFRGAY